MRVYLLGFMGSGKSTIGKKLASKMGVDFIDLDDKIEEATNSTIEDIFALKGEAHFRKQEEQVLKTCSVNDSGVVALGGGTPCFHDNLEIIKKTGVSVYLKLNKDEVYSRLSKNRGNRPIIMTLNENELESYIEAVFSEREKFYEQADISIGAFDFNAKKYTELIEKIRAYSK